MKSKYSAPGLAELETIDRVARAAYLWIRHGRTVHQFPFDDGGDEAHVHNLAAGVISGLCEALELGHRYAVYSAYAYALLDDQTEHALAVAYPLFHPHIDKGNRAAFEAGREAADNLIAMLKWPELDHVPPAEYHRGADRH